MLRVFTDSDGISVIRWDLISTIGHEHRDRQQLAAQSGWRNIIDHFGSAAHATIHTPHRKFRSPDTRPWELVTGGLINAAGAGRHRPGELPR